MRSFIVEFPAFGAWRSMKIRISAMIESPKAGSEMLQSPEARAPLIREEKLTRIGAQGTARSRIRYLCWRAGRKLGTGRFRLQVSQHYRCKQYGQHRRLSGEATHAGGR